MELGGWVTQVFGTFRASLPECMAVRGVANQPAQCVGQSLVVTRRHQEATGIVHNLQRASECRGDDRQSRPQRLDECDAERFRSRVRLAIQIGGLHQSRDVGAMTEEPNAIGNAILFQ